MRSAPWPPMNPQHKNAVAQLHEDLGRIYNLLLSFMEHTMATQADVTTALANLTTAFQSGVTAIQTGGTENAAFLDTVVTGLNTLSADITAALTPPAAPAAPTA